VITFLKNHIQKITTVEEQELHYVLSHFKPKSIKKNQFLVQEGMAVPDDHLVTSGLLKAYHVDEEGKEHILQFAMEEWWITDYQAYFNNTKASIYIDCIEDAQLLCLSLQNREKICAEIHNMEHFFRKKTSAGYVALQQRLIAMLCCNAKQRYNKLVQQYPLLLQRVPKKYIAAYLGVTRETLSRLGK
jgi:CRP-like cAMP-binding protein